MGVQYTRTGGKPVGGQTYRQMASKLQEIFWEELTVAAIEGEAEAKAYIGIAGTQGSWNGAFKGRNHPNRGRIDTGAMQRAVSYRVHKGNNISIDVGWVHDLGSDEEYIDAQEHGFFAGGFRPGQTVEGMHMLAHLKYYMRDRVDLAMDRAMKRVTDGL